MAAAVPDEASRRDNRPFLVLGGALALLILLALVPATRGLLVDHVVDPLRAQADPEAGLRQGYSLPGLAFWALLGAVFAWSVYELAFVRLGVEPDRAFFISLAPFLVFGPLYHALLVAGALPLGTFWAYLAAEPLIYLTTGILAATALLSGALLERRLVVPLGLGLLFLAPLLVLAAPHVEAVGAWRALALLALALVPAFVLAFLFHRFRQADPLPAVFAVIAAHALDGSTTWMVLRDPFGMGFEGFGERNPISETLVNISNGWPFFAVKLALPILLLALVKTEEGEERLRAFLLLAVFTLGYGPGMANLLQVVLA